jgi:hypothetical protein
MSIVFWLLLVAILSTAVGGLAGLLGGLAAWRLLGP